MESSPLVRITEGLSIPEIVSRETKNPQSGLLYPGIVLQAWPGTEVGKAAQEVVLYWNRVKGNIEVFFIFNDTLVKVLSGMSAADIVDKYYELRPK